VNAVLRTVTANSANGIRRTDRQTDRHTVCVCVQNAEFVIIQPPVRIPTIAIHTDGRVMAVAVSRRPFTAEDLVRSQVSPCEMCGGQSGTGTSFSPGTSVSPVSIIPPMPHTHSFTYRRRCIILAADRDVASLRGALSQGYICDWGYYLK
jgi:hypothetical protein